MKSGNDFIPKSNKFCPPESVLCPLCIHEDDCKGKPCKEYILMGNGRRTKIYDAIAVLERAYINGNDVIMYEKNDNFTITFDHSVIPEIITIFKRRDCND